LSLLLNTNDLDVLTSVLRLLLKPASRISGQRSLKTSFSPMQERLIVLAQNWGIPELDKDFSWIAQQKDTTLVESLSLKYQFYKRQKVVVKEETSDNKEVIMLQSPPKSRLPSESSSSKDKASSPTSDGLVQISISNLQKKKSSDSKLLNSLIAEYAVPEEHSFALYHKLRVVRHVKDLEFRQKCMEIRLLALAVCSKSFE
jgi:E3 ubiquitin-protein ligase HUWE1